LNENKDNPADILREPTSGRFATHEHNLPELTLERPYGEDQRRLAELGFVVSHDRALIEGYTVEPNVWVQSAAVPDFPAAQLSEAHHDALLRAEVILDRRRRIRHGIRGIASTNRMTALLCTFAHGLNRGVIPQQR
jgi:hypothetical protein